MCLANNMGVAIDVQDFVWPNGCTHKQIPLSLHRGKRMLRRVTDPHALNFRCMDHQSDLANQRMTAKMASTRGQGLPAKRLFMEMAKGVFVSRIHPWHRFCFRGQHNTRPHSRHMLTAQGNGAHLPHWVFNISSKSTQRSLPIEHQAQPVGVPTVPMVCLHALPSHTKSISSVVCDSLDIRSCRIEGAD